MENARKIVQEGEKARVVARSTLAQSSERAAEISKQAVEKAEFVRRQIEAVPNKKEIVSAAAAATAATAAISTVLAEPLMTMAGSIVAFSLVKSFETMDEQLRQKQKEIETKKREEKVDLLMKTKERKVETRVEVVDAPLEVVSAVTSSTPPVEERVKTTREEKKIVEKEEELLGASAAAATTTQQATTTPRSRTATNSATSGFVSQIANENETALFEARKKREQILNEMAQYNDAPATTKNGNTMRPGKLAETTNNKYFANRATKRTADVLGLQHHASAKRSNGCAKRTTTESVDDVTVTIFIGKKETRRRYENQSLRRLLRRVCLSVYAFARTLQSVRGSLEKVLLLNKQRRGKRRRERS